MKNVVLVGVLLAAWPLLLACEPGKKPGDEAVATEAATAHPAGTMVATDTARVGLRPRLLTTLPDSLNTPDGLVLAPDGRVFLSVPNLADNSKPAHIIELTSTGYRPFINRLLPEPSTGKAAPMDLAFGPDGNLYYAENQYENSKEFKSRLMRVRMKNGQPGAIETAVDNFALANAVVWKGNTIYVTDSQWDLPGNDKSSAVLRFELAELNRGTVHLKPKTMDPHVLATFTTTVNETGVDNGADGLDYDSRGNFYTGSFGDGTLYKMTLDPAGKLLKQEELALQGPRIPCVDGLIIDRKTDKLYLCNSRENAIELVDLRHNNAVSTLARNADTDGTGGQLDQPAEVLLKGQELLVTDFDKPEKHFVNTKSDAPHTMSVIGLK